MRFLPWREDQIVKTLLIIASIIIITWATGAKACDNQCHVTPDNAYGYYAQDHFSWDTYDNDVHLLLGFGGSLIIGEALTRYAKLPAWESALIGAVAMGMIGSFKEIMLDSYSGRTDQKMYWAGGLAGGLTVVALHF